MSVLLLKLTGYYALNRTIFPPKIFIYEDAVVYKKRKMFFWLDEITFTYNQIAQVGLKAGLIFAHLTLASTGQDHIIVKYLFKWRARLAKKIIDQKVYHAHAKHMGGQAGGSEKKTSRMNSFEHALSRIEELAIKGRLSKRQYKKKKRELLKKMM
jgi:hypothetical protein